MRMNASTGWQPATSTRTAPDDDEERLNGAAEAVPLQNDRDSGILKCSCNQFMNDGDKAKLTPRPVRESISEMTEIVLPNDANPLNALLGGRLMHWIDLAGAMAAHRHSRAYVVTASVDHMDFLVPVRVGDLVVLRSSVNRVFNTSMEVGVKVFVENYISDTAQHVSSAYLTFVAIDDAGHHLQVAPVVPETENEMRRYEGAARRREIRRAESARRGEVRIK